MKNLITVFLILPAVQLIFSQEIEGSGIIVQKEYDVERFEKIILNIPSNLVFISGPSDKIYIEADENYIQHINSYTRDGKLILTKKDEIWFNFQHPITFMVPSDDVVEIDKRAGDIITDENLVLKKPFLTINSRGTGKTKLNIDVEKLTITKSGSSNITIEGSSDKISAECRGSGHLDLSRLKAGIAELKMNGSVAGTINCKNYLTVNLKGSSRINVVGKPTNIKSNGNGNLHFLK